MEISNILDFIYTNKEAMQFIVIVALMVVSFLLELVPMEVTALATLGLFWILGILDIEQIISGFGNKAVVTIGAIFIISKSLVKTGFLEVLADYLYKIAGNRPWLSFFIFFVTVSVISGFINNTAAVAIFIPLAINLCQRFHISPTKVLLPLSYAAIFGGTLTLIGTSTNIIVNTFLEEKGLATFTMFEFAKLGWIFIIIGIVYIMIVGRWLLPSRSITTSLTQKYHMRTFLTEFKVTAESQFNNASLFDLNIKKYDVMLLKVIRDKEEIIKNLKNVKLIEDDILIMQINIKDIIKFKNEFSLLLLSDVKLSQSELAGDNYVIVEGLIPQNSSLIGKTISKIDFRHNFNSFVLAIRKQNQLLREKVAHIQLQFSDTLLIMVPRTKLKVLQDSNDLIILEELDVHLRYQKYWWLSIIIIPMVMILSSYQIISITEGAIMGAIILLLLRTLSMEEAYQSINWPVIFLIALLIPIGIAMEKTGAGKLLSDNIEHVAELLGDDYRIQAVRVVSILYMVTFLASAFISNAAVAIILSPLAIILGNHFILEASIDPTRAFLMAICFGASASFMTPIGYQTNLMVFTPGQYKFKDYMYAGLPLTLIFWVVASIYIPRLWPF